MFKLLGMKFGKTDEEKKQDKLKSSIKTAGKQYLKHKERLQRARGLNTEQEKRESAIFFKTYGPLIEECISNRINLIEDNNIREMNIGYNKYKGDLNIRAEENINSAITSDMLDKFSPLSKDNNKLTDEQVGQVDDGARAGISKVGQWLYEHSGTRHQAFIHMLMSKNEREQLFIYYLVEKNKRKNPTPKDLVDSQSGYVPDISKIKSQITPSKFKFWKWGKTKYHWYKFDDAAQAAAEMRDMFRVYGLGANDIKIQGLHVEEDEKKEENQQEDVGQNNLVEENIIEKADKEDQDKAGNNEGEKIIEQQQEESQIAEDISEIDLDKSIIEDYKGDQGDNEIPLNPDVNIIEKLQNHKRLIMRLEGKTGELDDKDKESLNKSVEELKQAFEAFQKWLDRAPAMEPDEKQKGMDAPFAQAPGFKDSELTGYVATGAKIVGKGAASPYSSYNVSLMGYEPVKAIFNESFARGCNIGGNGLGTAAGVISIIGVVIKLVEIKKSAPLEMGSTIAFQLMESLSQLLTGGSGATLSTSSMIGTIAGVTAEEMVKNSSYVAAGQAGNILGGVAGAINMGLGISNVVRSNNSQKHLDNARQKFNERVFESDSRKTVKNDPSVKQLSKDDEKQNALMMKLDRDFSTKKFTGGLQIGAGVLQVAGGVLGVLAATGVGAPIATALGVIGGLVAGGIALYSFLKARSNRKKSVDEYLKVDFVVSKAEEYFSQKYGAKWEDRIKTEYGIKGKKGLKEQIRYELMARINCHDSDSAYRYINRQYAIFLYRKTYFKPDGRTPFTTADENDPDFRRAQEEYVPILKSIKLRPKYPNAEEADKTPNLSVDVIATKLFNG